MNALESRKPDPCRLCGGTTAVAFSTRILGRYWVSFYVCDTCRCLQSEIPYWLDQAYQQAIVATDTGAVRRNVICHAAITCVARVLGVRGRFLDFGGGTGMLCRLLRDRGFDAYVHDKYAEPVYASGFVLNLRDVEPGSVGLLSAIEVLEHCTQPASEVGQLFAVRPQVLLATTIPYRGEDESWWYLSAGTGQHIFFFSQEGLSFLAQQHGYHYFGVGAFHVFSLTPVSRGNRMLLELLLSRVGLRAVTIWMAATQRTRHSDADFRVLQDKLARDSEGARRKP